MDKKVVNIKQVSMNSLIDSLRDGEGTITDAIIAYKSEGMLYFEHTALGNRTEMIGLLEYVKHGILDE